VRLWAIASATFRQTIRQVQFWVLLLIGVILMTLMFFLPFWAEDEDVKMFKDIGLAFTQVMLIISAVLSASRMVEEELADGTAATVLSKPLYAWHYVGGKFLGLTGAMIVGLAVLGGALCLLTYYKPDMSWHRLPFPPELRLLHVATVAASLPLVVLTIAVMVAFSVAAASRFGIVVNLTVCLMVYTGGRLIWGLKLQEGGGATGFLADTVGLLIPNLEYFNITDTIAYHLDVDWGALWRCFGIEAAYALIYCLIPLIVAEALVRRRLVE
jgi:ABC-type transport system involved in multi-copper enzyme maturation permease subunit